MRGRVALFVTCLVDLLRPSIAFATVRLLEQAGFDVVVPEQGCCGQPNFNGGDRSGATQMARQLMRRFDDVDYLVAPSGSCAAMVRCHYPALFAEGSDEHRRAAALAGKTFELTSFLVNVAGANLAGVGLPGRATYHDGCSGLRELGVREQPRELLQKVRGLEMREMPNRDTCCGFGGLFCVKYADISTRIAEQKLADIETTNADYLIGGDLGCLLQLEGKLHRDGSTIDVLHVAEVLAGISPAQPGHGDEGEGGP